jgi:hypothetical protein
MDEMKPLVCYSCLLSDAVGTEMWGQKSQKTYTHPPGYGHSKSGNLDRRAARLPLLAAAQSGTIDIIPGVPVPRGTH